MTFWNRKIHEPLGAGEVNKFRCEPSFRSYRLIQQIEFEAQSPLGGRLDPMLGGQIWNQV